tara:strand:+ start:68 stop:739 length:672 start_codon:yes stop_codon:yes gene_type:complete
MINVKINAMQLNKTLNNVVDYSEGFLKGIDMKSIEFNNEVANFTHATLNKYIDSQARMNPLRLHHVYEWGKAGNQSSRLFDFDTRVLGRTISFTGKFLPSKSVSNTSSEPFVNKANIMENDIQVVIEPKNSDVLVFENNGETVFTTNAIYIDHPGGDEVAGSFGETVSNFFDNYFTNGLLKPLINKLSTANEFTASFSSGARSGSNVGIRAGKEYLNLKGVVE